jgi:predicted DNA-binding antitoxin AbrB/MazE fold protein
MVSVRAVYHEGQLRLLEPVNLQEGQEVQLQIVEVDEIPLRELIGDILAPPFKIDEADEIDEIDEKAIQQQLDEALTGLRPLSEIIIEDRGE